MPPHVFAALILTVIVSAGASIALVQMVGVSLVWLGVVALGAVVLLRGLRAWK